MQQVDHVGFDFADAGEDDQAGGVDAAVEEGLGLGDAKLFAASGTWLGLPLLPYVLLIAALGGLAWALIARAQGRLAFGPWIALGFWCVWLARGPGSWG